jgi:hypothetical protein
MSKRAEAVTAGTTPASSGSASLDDIAATSDPSDADADGEGRGAVAERLLQPDAIVAGARS